MQRRGFLASAHLAAGRRAQIVLRRLLQLDGGRGWVGFAAAAAAAPPAAALWAVPAPAFDLLAWEFAETTSAAAVNGWHNLRMVRRTHVVAWAP